MTSLNFSIAQLRDSLRRPGGHALQTRLAGWGLLALRLWLAQEFGQAGWLKLSSGLHAPDWFVALTFPGPLAWLPADLNWWAAGGLELAGAVALLLGWHARLASAALLFVTCVAVVSAHADLGWAGWNQIESEQGQGFKVPLMIALMLLTVLTQGAGRWARSGAGLRG